MSTENNTVTENATAVKEAEVQIINLLNPVAENAETEGGCCGGSCHA
ncbi:MAG: hypothetical protein WBA28_08175 [Microbacteriaceae bacterium]